MPTANEIAGITQTPGNTSSLVPPDRVNKQQFLDLLVSQLKAQDPFEPVKNEAFLAQLATFSSLEEQQVASTQLKNLVALQSASLALSGLSQSASLVGRDVEYLDPTTGTQMTGVVSRVLFEQEGVMVEIGGKLVPAGNVVVVGGLHNSAATPTSSTPATAPNASGANPFLQQANDAISS